MIATKSISIAEQIFERLEADILSGKYPEGEILTELRLSGELGVSRTPIREAIRRLEQENILTESGKGAVVIGVSENDLVDIYEVRMRIEGLATARLTERITDEQLKNLREVIELQEYYTAKADADQIKQTDTTFHSLIYDYCGSSVLRDTLTVLHRKIQRYRKLSVEDGVRAAMAAAEHREIYNAIAAKDAPLAEKLIIKHIKNALDSILSKEKTMKEK